MSRETDINGLYVPELEDNPPDIEVAFTAIDQIDSLLPSRFDTVSERNTAIPVPVFGQISAISETGELYFYDGSGWAGLKPRLFLKTATQSFSTAVAASVDDFTIPVEANSRYIMRGSIVGATDAADLYIQWTTPSGVTGDWILRGGSSPDADTTYITAGYRIRNAEWSGVIAINTPVGGAGVYYRWDIEGLLITSATAGNVVMQARENVAAGGSVRIYQESYLTFQKIT